MEAAFTWVSSRNPVPLWMDSVTGASRTVDAEMLGIGPIVSRVLEVVSSKDEIAVVVVEFQSDISTTRDSTAAFSRFPVLTTWPVVLDLNRRNSLEASGN